MFWYWMAALILVLVNACCVAANLLMLPGNWIMLGTLCIFVIVQGTAVGPDWTTVLVVLGLAVAGEVLETISGAARASQVGASRRAMLMSLLLSMAGALAGALLIPIPVVGSALGAVAGAASGAFAGAWLGESWKGTVPEKRTEISTAAMTGRMIGMIAKFSIGVAIFAFQLISVLI